MRYLFSLLVLVMLVGYNNNATSAYYCRKSVESTFPNSEISLSPDGDTPFRYLIREPNGNIWYVETLSGNGPEITKKELVFKGKQ